MLNRITLSCAPILLAVAVISFGESGARADDAGWRVRKSSGDVWMTTSTVQQASLTNETVLKAGDHIRTGRNGRVLLVRGEETILISPNSVIGIPAETQAGETTTIVQQAGSIVLEVEKRDHKHFAVETPYLVAAVKGTQFRVSVNRYGTTVDVRAGAVEVADYKSGQYAIVLPGQTAKVSVDGPAGLSLSGSGTLNPVQNGTPRTPPVTRVPVPRQGLSAPERSARLKHDNHAGSADAARRIASPLGDVKVDFLKVTKGLARAETNSMSARDGRTEQTMWKTGELARVDGGSKSFGGGSSTNDGGSSTGGGGGGGNAYAYGHTKDKDKDKVKVKK